MMFLYSVVAHISEEECRKYEHRVNGPGNRDFSSGTTWMFSMPQTRPGVSEDLS
jgi:hypothetical protein